ncbi:putative sugar transporter ERD6-like 16-like [Capsicum annuum]|uniref:squamosa promoter-binding-like protein 7 isoform X2 n=1 Tax=Capsicum annuum TaxID=4072 RepID=UPI0007BFBA85|nr:squamosa promoter-binding-like protein 7 isoform X2 [Capsicum annuum]KAF3614585.1 putative sugar transporter ERD6-like 16-like [Capsicum annuum]KAF3644231.1 putative sugar transporter ERD6-like 16-like [Capsicum annuum]
MDNQAFSPSQTGAATRLANTHMTFSGVHDDPATSSLFDWADLLEFNLDEQLTISFDDPLRPPPETQPMMGPVIPSSEDSPQSQDTEAGRIRKRDPRMVCSNFLAGRIPCACPELDEKMEEEELAGIGPGKKRARTVRASAGAGARCQVPDCEADISELKGYHKRHRVCLRCANASAVLLDGHNKRYCQQCGKFHILSDFDEGKRSCRRKLERHNNRRRRKATDSSKTSAEKESQQVTMADDGSGDDDIVKDSTCMGSQLGEKEILLESEGHVPIDSTQGIQNNHSDSFTASGETQADAEKENFKSSHSPSYYDSKSGFSSACPTGRISFKLYDWNPAEFPRRLRHQIFQWLASMPVELEGYIRPGCTILTVFVAMPTFKWGKLLKDPAAHLYELIASPGNMLRGRGSFLVYLNDMVFRVTKGGDSIVKVKLKGPAPKLKSIHPMCFEAGKPMEFIACGNNLMQPRFRFLVSFGGTYLGNDTNVVPSGCKSDGDSSSMDHQLLKIHVPRTEAGLFGPAFVEVENESGLSNFIPILIAEKDICAEMKEIQRKFCCGVSERTAVCSPSEASTSRKSEFSEFMLDVAWLLREPSAENVQILASVQMQRFNYLLNILMESQSTIILERVLSYFENMVKRNMLAGITDADMRLFQRNIREKNNLLKERLHRKEYFAGDSRQIMQEANTSSQIFQNHMLSVFPVINQDTEVVPDKHNIEFDSTYWEGTSTVPLLDAELALRVKEEQSVKSCGFLVRKTVVTSRTLVFLITGFAVCLGLCATFLHPRKVGEFAMTIRRCLFDRN